MIYLSQQKKKELEAKIAELEHKNNVIGGITYKEVLNVYKEILSEAIVLPVQESWEIAINRETILNISYPNGVIIKQKQ